MTGKSYDDFKNQIMAIRSQNNGEEIANVDIEIQKAYFAGELTNEQYDVLQIMLDNIEEGSTEDGDL